MSLEQLKVRLEGVSPLITNRFTDESAEEATSGTRGVSNGDRLSPHDDAESRLYKDEDGTIVVPACNLLASFMDGGRFHKIGKKQVTTNSSSLLPGCISISPGMIPLISEKGWSVDKRPIQIPSGGRILRYRPVFYDWGLEIDVTVMTKYLSVKLFREIVDDAGMLMGLGDFRPARKGPFGRYKVTLWEKVKQ